MWGGVGMGAAAPRSACSACWWKAPQPRHSAGPGGAHCRRQAGGRAGGWGSGVPSPRKGTLWGRSLQELLRTSKVRGSPQACFLFSFLFLLKLPPGRKELGSGAGFAPGAGPGHPSPGGRTPLSCRTHQQELERKEDPASDQPP